MARRTPAPRQNDSGKAALQERAVRRLEMCRQQKAMFDQDMREAYWFAAPHRSRTISSNSPITNHSKPQDAGELNTSFAMELAGDFSTVVVNTFFPQGEPWALRKAAAIVQDDTARKEIERQATLGDKAVFDAIGESNLYSEVGKGFTPDLAIGCVGMWSNPIAKGRPMKFTSVPLRELEINIGPDGDVDDRFAVRHIRAQHIAAVLPGIPLPDHIKEMVEKEGDKTCCIARGFWRIYQEDGSTQWQYVCLIDNFLVHDTVLKGDGSCPLNVARFGASADFAFSAGPLIQALPDLRVVDELAMKRIRGIDLTLEPPIAFPDDSFANIEEGIEPGMAYRMRPGSESAIKNIYDPPPQDPAIYFSNDLETRIKRIFFLDYPDQPGKTPPTATQWLDEMTMAQRRIGTPGLPFWREFCAETFVRVQYVLEQAGIVKKITDNNGDTHDGVTRLYPYNPAEKAIEQQKVAQFGRFVQIAGQAFPEEFKLASDGISSIDKLSKMMSVDDIWSQRDADQQKAIIGNLAQLKGGATPGAPAIPDGAPVPQPQAGAAPIAPTLALKTNAA